MVLTDAREVDHLPGRYQSERAGLRSEGLFVVLDFVRKWVEYALRILYV